MVALLEEYNPSLAKTDPPAKKCSTENFCDSDNRVEKLLSQAQDLRPVKVVLSYETASGHSYGPFGEIVSKSGDYADENTYRFSTKSIDVETGYYYYGLRFFSPSLGRFLSRDPIQEAGGLGIYIFVANNGINLWDVLGLLPRSVMEGNDNDALVNALLSKKITAARAYVTEDVKAAKDAMYTLGTDIMGAPFTAKNLVKDVFDKGVSKFITDKGIDEFKDAVKDAVFKDMKDNLLKDLGESAFDNVSKELQDVIEKALEKELDKVDPKEITKDILKEILKDVIKKAIKDAIKDNVDCPK